MSSQPYLYNSRPNSISEPPFDPKAITRASWTRPGRKPAPTGPYIDFNEDPDGHGGDMTDQIRRLQNSRLSMHARTTHRRLIRTVRFGRWVQLAIRVSQLAASLSLLVCVICVKNVQSPASWLIRLPAAVGILASSYGVYNVLSARTGKTPGSAASYHFFALIIDLGLVAFLVFTAMAAKSSLGKDPRDETRWQSLIQPGVSDPDFQNASIRADTTLVKVIAWVAVVLAVLHLLSAAVSFVLLLAYRRAAAMPPDMNPLDTDNDRLTRRRHTFGIFRRRNTDALPPHPTPSEFTLSNSRGSGRTSVKSDGSSSYVPKPASAMVVSNSTGNRNSMSTYRPVPPSSSHSQGRPVTFMETRLGSSYSSQPAGSVEYLKNHYQRISGTGGSNAMPAMHYPSAHAPATSSRPTSLYSRNPTLTMASPITSPTDDQMGPQSWIVHNPDSSMGGTSAPGTATPRHYRTGSAESTSSQRPKRYRGSRPVSVASVDMTGAVQAQPSPGPTSRGAAPPSAFVNRLSRQ